MKYIRIGGVGLKLYRVKGESRDIHQAACIIHPQTYNGNGPLDRKAASNDYVKTASIMHTLPSEHRFTLLSNAPTCAPSM